MKITTGEIANIVKGTVDGDPDVVIHGPSPIENGLPGTVSFLSNPKYEQFLYKSNASAVLVHEDFSPQMKINPSLIRVKDVAQSIAVLFTHFSRPKSIEHHISELAFIDNSANIENPARISEFSRIGKKSKVGKGTEICSQVFIGENVKIGKDCIFYPGVKIYDNCVIGDRAIIHANTVIGTDGFGFNKDNEGNYKKIPHLGKVVIEDDVEIGSNCVIDRGTLGDTIIKSGVKLDNLIQIAHNVELGENTVMAAQSGVAGSAKIGQNCIVGGQVGIVGHIQVANGTMIQGQSGVNRTIKEENSKLYGSPAISYTNYLRSYAKFKNLPEMAQELSNLQKELATLKELLNKTTPEK